MFFEFLTQNILWVGAFFVVVNLLLWSILQGHVKGAGSISALELPQLQRNGEFTIIDVNPPEQFATGHIPDAVNYPIASLNAENTNLLKLKDKTTIIVCQTGSKSNQATKKLISLGFNDCHILRGGMQNWSKEKLPVTVS